MQVVLSYDDLCNDPLKLQQYRTNNTQFLKLWPLQGHLCPVIKIQVFSSPPHTIIGHFNTCHSPISPICALLAPCTPQPLRPWAPTTPVDLYHILCSHGWPSTSSLCLCAAVIDGHMRLFLNVTSCSILVRPGEEGLRWPGQVCVNSSSSSSRSRQTAKFSYNTRGFWMQGHLG